MTSQCFRPYLNLAMKEIVGIMTSMGMVASEKHFTALFRKPIVNHQSPALMSLHRVYGVVTPQFRRWCEDKHIDMDCWPKVDDQFVKPLDDKTLKWALLSCIQHY